MAANRPSPVAVPGRVIGSTPADRLIALCEAVRPKT
jgi:hypothetical protein